eukprot:scaffold6365_cov255-Prasinococcus_capsulatus_cf.AAC.2
MLLGPCGKFGGRGATQGPALGVGEAHADGRADDQGPSARLSVEVAAPRRPGAATSARKGATAARPSEPRQGGGLRRRKKIIGRSAHARQLPERPAGAPSCRTRPRCTPVRVGGQGPTHPATEPTAGPWIEGEGDGSSSRGRSGRGAQQARVGGGLRAWSPAARAPGRGRCRGGH